MSEPIDRRTLLNNLCKECGYCKRMEDIAEGSVNPCNVYRIISEQPTIESDPVRHGRWDNNGTGSRIYPYLCTECKESCDYPFPYCPICGAKMDGGADNGCKEML